MTSPLMKAILRGASDDMPERPARPLMAAQRHELLIRHAAYHKDSEAFEAGQLVRFKAGLGTLTTEARADHAMIFWRYLDYNEWLDRQILKREIKSIPTRSMPDCLIGCMSNDGASVAFELVDSGDLELEPADDAEVAA